MLVNFKFIISLICLSSLLYQTISLIEQYLEFNAVINIKFKQNSINSLPAITICYNRLYSFEKLVERYPKKRDDYENYINFTKQFYGTFEIETKNGQLISEQNKYYSKMYHDIIKSNDLNKLIMNSPYQFDYEDIFDNLTLPLGNYTSFERYHNSNFMKHD